MRFNITLKLILMLSIVSMGFVIPRSYFTYKANTKKLEEKLGLSLLHIANTTIIGIKESEHRRIRSSEDEKKSSFKNIRNFLDQVREMNELEKECIYTFQVGESTNKFKFAVMLSTPTFIGNEYNVPDYNQKFFKKVISGESVYTSLYKDDHGQWISALAPIISKKGKVTGILEVDYKVNKYLKEVDAELQEGLILALLTLVLGLIAVIIIAFYISSPIKKITGAAKEISQGNYDIQLRVSTNDEVGDLNKQFNQMAGQLKEKFHMLKYIPEHTLEKVKTSLSSTSNKSHDERKNIVILISDIRGFTRFVEKHSPATVMAVVNEYLELQTKIISKNGGTIDKYVGDEIIALFDGDKKSIRASLSACDIHEEIRRMNLTKKDQAMKLQVGIGVNAGFVVMGDIGSSQLKDYTAVGTNVNLASRMCSGARPGETIISASVQKEIQDSDEREVFEISSKGEEFYKGISKSVQIYSVSKA